MILQTRIANLRSIITLFRIRCISKRIEFANFQLSTSISATMDVPALGDKSTSRRKERRK